ncbi:NADH-quinone oxidoreductase subunit K [Telmatospirillum sp. J64-1]|uniref:NADH-quinone oxidoreductase subunit K n=1 Tax=Telmatospirillum sp. J64-1 TaxID=2502183 RepID=UPI00115D9BEC|nr:NADH-quinone oxidoreductase subunit K [Telmatospirillum sp. J64-1]
MITQGEIYALAGLAVFAVALHGLFARRHLLRKIVAINIAGSGVFLFLVAVTRSPEEGVPDPLAQVMVLTGIVISVSIAAYSLSLLRRIVDDSGSPVLPEDGPPPQEDEGK